MHFDAANECESNVELALNAAKEFNVSVLFKGANSIVADNKKAWQLFGTDSHTARAGLGDLLSGFIAGSSAIDLTFCKNISTDFFAKYVLLHSFAASKCKKGSNASAIGDELSKLMRNIKMRQISWKKQFKRVIYSFKHISVQILLEIWSAH